MGIERAVLYEEIWAEPITKVSKRYGVSDSYLVRILKRLNIPRPPLGYWAMLAAGIKSEQPALPDAKPGDEIEWSRDGMPARRLKVLPVPPNIKAATRTRSKANRPERHPLVIEGDQQFKNVRYSSSAYLKPYKKLMLDLIVSPKALNRGLDIANELFLSLEDRGHHVTLNQPHNNLHRHEVDEREKPKHRNYSDLWHPCRATVVYLGTVAIGLSIYEISEEVEVRYLNGKYIPVSELPQNSKKYDSVFSWTTKHDIPSGRFCIQAYSPYSGTQWLKQWTESKVGDFPAKLKSIIRELELVAPKIVELVEIAEHEAEIRHREWEAQKERWRIEEEEKKKADAIKTSTTELLKIIDAWTDAKRIEAFFNDVENQLSMLNDADRGVMLKRLEEARALLDNNDALQHFIVWKSPDAYLRKFPK